MRHKILFCFLTVLVSGSSCKRYLDINIDPSSPSSVAERDLLPGIETDLGFNIAGGAPAIIGAMWTQQLAYNTESPSWETYSWQPTDADNTWSVCFLS